MEEILVEVKIVKSEGKRAGIKFNLDCGWSKYITKSTASKVKSLVERIYAELPEELILYHHLKNRPIFFLKEEKTGIYMESPYIDLIKGMAEYNSWLEAVILAVKKDYAVFCLKEKGRAAEGKAS